MNQELPLVKWSVDAKFKLEREASERRAYVELTEVYIYASSFLVKPSESNHVVSDCLFTDFTIRTGCSDSICVSIVSITVYNMSYLPLISTLLHALYYCLFSCQILRLWDNKFKGIWPLVVEVSWEFRSHLMMWHISTFLWHGNKIMKKESVFIIRPFSTQLSVSLHDYLGGHIMFRGLGWCMKHLTMHSFTSPFHLLDIAFNCCMVLR